MTVASEFVTSAAIMAPCSCLRSIATCLGGDPPALEASCKISSASCPSSWEGQEAGPSSFIAIGLQICQEPVTPATLSHAAPKLSIESCSSGRRSLTSVGTHSSYASGEERPLLRGWLHGILAIFVFPVALAAVAVALCMQAISPRWITMGLLLAGKFMSCAASGVLHLFPFQKSAAVKRALKVDLVMIPVSIGVSGFPFTQQYDEALVIAAIQAMFVVLTVIEVVRRSRIPSISIDGGGVRICLILTQFIGTISYVGFRAGFESPLWMAMSLTYLVSFISYKKPLGQMSWHRVGLCGSHEDFHTLLFLGDVLLIVLAVHFLLENDSV